MQKIDLRNKTHEQFWTKDKIGASAKKFIFDISFNWKVFALLHQVFKYSISQLDQLSPHFNCKV